MEFSTGTETSMHIQAPDRSQSYVMPAPAAQPRAVGESAVATTRVSVEKP
jgi:general secretion pathway protein D